MTKEEIDNRLQNAKVGAITGTRESTYIAENYPNAQLMQFDSMSDAVAVLKSGYVIWKEDLREINRNILELQSIEKN